MPAHFYYEVFRLIQIASALIAAILASGSSHLASQRPPEFHPSRAEIAQADLLCSLTAGNLSAVAAALKAGANPNEPDFIDQSALFYAGDVATVKLLIQHGADVHVVTPKGSALTVALLGENDAVGAFLIQHGAPVSAPRKDKMTPVMAAALNGTAASLKLLIAAHVDLNAQDREGTTPLMFAVRGNQLGAAKSLISAGAKVGAKDKLQRTAVHYAALRGNAEMVALLVHKGASVNAVDVNGDTPLHLAAKYSGDPKTVKALLKMTKSVSVRDKSGFTPGALAVRYSSAPVAACFGRTCATPADVKARTAEVVVRPALHRIEASLATFVQKSGCVSCHHQGLGVMALTQAAQHRFDVNKGVIGECMKQMAEDGKEGAPAMHAAAQDPKFTKMLPAVHLGDQVYGGAYILGALRSAGVPPNPGFGEGVTVMGRLQLPDGRFNSIRRGIMEHSDVMTTGLTLGLLKTYWPADQIDEYNKIAAKAKAWAFSTKPTCAEDYAGRLLILSAANGDSTEIDSAAASLLGTQRADGGWGIPQRLVSDSYTTGACLYALRTVAKVDKANANLKKAVAFLVRTQENDGSWYEPKLTPAYNNHFDSSFPHGYDQFASFAGTCWATMGLVAMTE